MNFLKGDWASLSAFTGFNVIAFWNDYFAPSLQGVILIASALGAVVVFLNKLMDYKLKKKELKENGLI